MGSCTFVHVRHVEIRVSLSGSAACHQVRIKAYDDVFPAQSSTATIDVRMQRNEHRPEWQHDTSLRYKIRETVPLGYVISEKPRATDRDGVSHATPTSTVTLAHGQQRNRINLLYFWSLFVDYFAPPLDTNKIMNETIKL